MQVDHIIPVSRGGDNDRENLVGACARCNLDKSDLLPHEWGEHRQAKGKPWPIPSDAEIIASVVKVLPEYFFGEHISPDWAVRVIKAGRESGFDPWELACEFEVEQAV